MLLLMLLTGCTAGRATYYLVDADRAYSDAVEAGAEEAAVYEFTMAWLYRDKAWEEWGYSDFQDAEELAVKAAEYARAAEEIALYGSDELEMIEDLDEVPDQIERIRSDGDDGPDDFEEDE